VRQDRDGWMFAHLEGAPERLGFQHGYLFAAEIAAVIDALRLAAHRETGRDWSFYRATAQRIFWPRVPEALRAELRGMVAGLRARGEHLDEWDLVAENAWLEIAWYYIPQLERHHLAAAGRSPRTVPPGMCSAFIATGSATAGGRVVMAHNAWIAYWLGRSWTAILDVVPTQGHHFIMDAIPGLVHSGDDFYISDAGLLVTETTIAGYHGFDPLGIPEFVRARLAIQHADGIDDWLAIMTRQSNGAYANAWLIGDRKTGEIAQLENGMRNQPVSRKRDGWFAGANFPSDPRLRAEETNYRARPDFSAETRRRRWEQLLEQHRGRIDVERAKAFLGDHFDVTQGREKPSSRTLCGHGDLDGDPRPEWHEPAFAPAGAVNAKATDSALASELSFWAAAGHPCGIRFSAAGFLAGHPEFAWQKPILRDLPGGPWTLFRSGR
jgi:hypothetical protein